MINEEKVLTIRREAGREYYCLDLSGETDPVYRTEIQEGIKHRNTTMSRATIAKNTTKNLFETPREKIEGVA